MMRIRNFFTIFSRIIPIALATTVAGMEDSDTAYYELIVPEIYKSQWAQGNPVLEKIKGKTPTHTIYQINSSGQVTTRGFYIENPDQTTPPENYYVFQHNISLTDRCSARICHYEVYLDTLNQILRERQDIYHHCSIEENDSWLRVLSLTTGIIDGKKTSNDKRTVLKKDLRGKKDTPSTTDKTNLCCKKPVGTEFTRISHVVHILEESFGQPDQAPSANLKSEIECPQNPVERSNATPNITQPQLYAFPAKQFWQRRFFWPTVGVACLLGGLFAYRSYLSSFLNQLRSSRV